MLRNLSSIITKPYQSFQTCVVFTIRHAGKNTGLRSLIYTCMYNTMQWFILLQYRHNQWFSVCDKQYWPKVTHAKKRTSHAGCNACDARFRRVLHRICYSNVAHMKRASCLQHLRGMCAGCCSGSMWHTRGMRTSDAFVASVSSIACIADVAHF
jgi:hypothetical protein